MTSSNEQRDATRDSSTDDNVGVLLIVTGASRGLGRAIALAFCRHYAKASSSSSSSSEPKPLRIVLLARSLESLQETRAELIRETITDHFAYMAIISVHAVDLGDLQSLERTWGEILDHNTLHGETDNGEPKSTFDRLIFINNAGSLGTIGPCISQSQELSEMKRVVDLNVTSSFWASVKFARFAQNYQAQYGEATALIVNISSLTAIQPFPSMGLYSAGKAARDMYHACLSQELQGQYDSNQSVEGQNRSCFKILNYAPGPLETDMTEDIRAAPNLDPSLKPHYQKQLVDPNDSAQVLVKIVTRNEFKSGSHVDYYDCC